MGGLRQKAGLALASLHIALLGFWVGWVGRAQEAGLPLSSLHVSFVPGPGRVGRGKEAGRQEGGLRLGCLHVFLLSGLPGRMGGPRLSI